jgi:tetratricopeptide (TPR) repeat protein
LGAGKREEAAEALAQIDVTKLEAVEQTAYLGGVLYLAGEDEWARRYLNLDANLPDETALALSHRAVEAWWKICARTGNQPETVRGLLAAYRGLEEADAPPDFWRQDEAREIALIRSLLLRGQDIEDARRRLESLLGHVPFSPEGQALRAFALALSGQPRAAERCLEWLSSSDLRCPESALFYGVALASDGRKAAALPYLQRALTSGLSPEEKALALHTANVP